MITSRLQLVLILDFSPSPGAVLGTDWHLNFCFRPWKSNQNETCQGLTLLGSILNECLRYSGKSALLLFETQSFSGRCELQELSFKLPSVLSVTACLCPALESFTLWTEFSQRHKGDSPCRFLELFWHVQLLPLWCSALQILGISTFPNPGLWLLKLISALSFA